MATFTATADNTDFHATNANDTFDAATFISEISYNANFLLDDDALGLEKPAIRTVGITADLSRGAVTDSLGLSQTLLGTFNYFVATNFSDTITTGSYDTTIVGFDGSDTITGGAGWTEIQYDKETGGGAVQVNLALGTILDTYGNTDVVSNVNAVMGTNNADTFIAGDLQAVFRGLAGDDTFTGGSSTVDELRYDRDGRNGGTSGVVVNLTTGTATDGFGDTDTFTGFERVLGTSADDILTGNEANNRLRASEGDDQLFGLGGNDTFEVGTGIDTADGGEGDDTTIFSGARSDYDVSISDTEVVVTLTSSNGETKATLTNMEFLQFSDQTVDLRTTDTGNGANATTYELYRFFNSDTGSHFYTASTAERDSIIQNLPNFQYEGNSFGSNATADNGGSAVYRFYNTETGAHFYTASEEERQNILNTVPKYQEEGISYYSYLEKSDSNTELYRFYNTNTGTHFFTTDASERDNVINTLPQFQYEGVAYYVDFA